MLTFKNTRSLLWSVLLFGAGLPIGANAAEVKTPAVTAGPAHVNALRLDGAMFSWGDNSNSQLGDNTTSDRLSPVYVGTNRWLGVEAGLNHSLALRTDSTLWVWGDNAYGQLGNASTSSLGKPTQVGSARWLNVSAGGNFSLGLQKDSTLWVWGLNDLGQLGDGSLTDYNVPTQLGNDTWLDVAAGSNHGLGILSDGTLWSWGNNAQGQLGDGTLISKDVMNQVGTDTWKSVSAGDSVSAGIQADGTLWVWGKNTQGELGLGTTVSVKTPTQVGSATWSEVAVGYGHTVAIKADGTLWAWGNNAQGQLGDGTTTNRTSPVQIGSATWISVSVGDKFTVGMQSDSSIWVWGINGDGQLGAGNTTARTAPQKITTYPKMTQTITFAQVADTVYGTTGLTLAATSNSNLTVSYTSSTPLVCTVSGAALTLVNVGSCVINANQAGDADYAAATAVQRTFSVTKKTLTVSGLTAPNKVFDNNVNLTLTGTPALSGVVGSDVVTVNSTNGIAKFATATVDTAKAVTVTGYLLEGADAAKYSLTQPSGFTASITARPITVTAGSKTKVYGDEDPTLTWSLTSGSYAPGHTSAIVTGALERTAGEYKGTYAIGQGNLGVNSNYALTFVSANLVITPRPITITVDPVSKVYGATDPTFTFSSNEDPSVISGFLYRDTTSQNVGKYAILGDSLTVDTNYSPVTFVGDSLTITPKTLTVTAADTNKIYGDTDPVFPWTATGYAYSEDSTIVTGALSRDTGVNVGKYALRVGTLASANYAISFSGDSLTILPDTLTITAKPRTKVYGANDPILTWTATGFATGDGTGLVTGKLARAAGANVGKYAITQGTISAGSNYAITFVEDSLTISAKTLTVKADTVSKIYGATDPTLTWSAVGYANGDNSSVITGTLTRATGEDVGAYEIQQNDLAASSNYTLVYNADSLRIRVLPITLKADTLSKEYGDTDPTLTWSLAAGSAYGNGDDQTVVTGSLARVSGENAGKYLIQQGTIAISSNYSLTFVADTFTVNKKALAIVADAKTKAYGAADPILSWTGTGYATGEDSSFITGSLTRVAGKNVGTYAINQGTLANSNYDITYTGADLTITTKALTIKAVAKTKVYGGTDPVLTWTGTGFASGENISSIPGALTRVAGDSVGKYEIQQGTLANSNYAITFVPESLSVTPKTLTITAQPKTKVYGDVEPTYTWTGVGYVTGDNASVVTGNLYRDTTITGVGRYPILGDSLNAGNNYSIVYVGDTLTITPAALSVVADAQTKVYGDADPTLTYTAVGLVGADTLKGVLARESGNNVGQYQIRKGSLAAGANYVMTYTPDTLTVTQKTIAIKADSLVKIYGAVEPALTWSLTSGSFGYTDDQSVFAGSLVRDTGSSVGKYPIRLGTLANANYNFTFAQDTLEIVQRALTITADRKSKTYGAANPTYTWTAVGYAPGQSASDITGALSRVAGDTVGAYAFTQGTLANPNYAITFVPESLMVTERAITVTADAKSKAFGAADPSLTWRITSGTLATRDSLGVITGSLTRDAGSGVAKYAIRQGSLSATANYAMTFVEDSLSIVKASQVIAMAAISNKVYGDSLVLAPTASSSLATSLSVATPAICSLRVDTLMTLSKGICQVLATQAGDSGYLAADTVVRQFQVERRVAVIAPKSVSKTYGEDDSVAALTYTAVGVLAKDSLVSQLARELGDSAATYKITAGDFADSTVDSNYIFQFDTTAKFVIKPKAMIVTADSVSKLYGDADPTLTWSAVGYITGEDSTLFTGTLTRAVGTNVGKYAITLGTLKATRNYAVTFVGDTLRINKRPLALVAAAKTKIYGSTDPVLTWTATGYATGETSSKVTGLLSRQAGNSIGKYEIQQGTLASPNYEITYTADSLTITPKALAIKAAAKTKVYGSADPALTYTATGLVTGDVLTGVMVRTTGDSVGAYPISQGTLNNANYTITFTGDTLKVTGKPVLVKVDSLSKIYGETDPRLTYRATGLLDGDTLVGLISRASGDTVNTYAIGRGTLADSSNPNYKITFTGANFKVLPKALTVKADSAFKAFGTPDSKVSLVYVATGLINGDTLTGKLSRVAGENIGRYAITLGTLNNRNYAITYQGDSLRIGKKAVMVVALPQTKIYTAIDPVLTFRSVGLAANEVLKGTLARAYGEKVGKYAIQIGTLATSNPNHAITFVGDSIEVKPKPIVVTAVAKSKVYGAVDPTASYTATGLSGSDVLSGTMTRVAGDNVGSYAYQKGTLANRNYDITFKSANLSITPKQLLVKADTGISKYYGNGDPTLTWTATGYAGSDNASALTGSLTRALGVNVGKYAITQGTLKATNYTIAFTGASLNIRPRPLTITATAATKVYGAVDPVGVWVGTGYAPGENATKIPGLLGRTAGTAVGKYPWTLGTLKNTNYAFTFVPETLSVTKRPVTVTAKALSKIYKSTDPALSYTTVGMVTGELLKGLLKRDTGSVVGKYAIAQGTVNDSANPNYNITFVADSFSIKPKPITVTVAAKSKTYGDTDPSFTYVQSGLVSGDSLSGSLSRASGSDAGVYAIQVGTLANSNYELRLVPNNLTILPKAATVTADSMHKAKNTEDPEITYTVSGLVGSDTLAGALSRTIGEAEGVYKITLGTLANKNYKLTLVSNKFVIGADTSSNLSRPILAEEDSDLEKQVVKMGQAFETLSDVQGAVVLANSQGQVVWSGQVTNGLVWANSLNLASGVYRIHTLDHGNFGFTVP